MAASNPGPAALELRGVSKRYGTGQPDQVTAADDVTFTIEAGCLRRADRCLRLGQVDPAAPDRRARTARFRGDHQRRHRGHCAALAPSQADYRRTVGFVFQRYNLLPALTALDNVIAPVLPYRTDFDRRGRARDLLAAVGLAGRERSLPARMSGGEQQRIAIARALINTPALLLADEPTGNLDSGNAAEILDLLARLRADHGMTIILASHDPQIAARAERLIRLRDGAVLDDIQLTGDHTAQDIIRHVGQLG